MNKKLFNKVITAVLTAALLFTSSGFASLNASAAEKIYVEGVYTNFQKATMSTQTSRQINAYVEPANATVQNLRYKSSAPEVASVSSTGLISALSPGKATITVTALDGSSQTETIQITVLEDLIITKDLVDSDNDVIVLDKTYGNVYIDGSVGDADIYLSGVVVRNILAAGSGEYSLYTYDSEVKELMIDDVPGEIESFAVTEEDKKAPNIIIGESTKISDLNARISASIRQEDGSDIEGLRVTQDADGKITIYLENYSGGLLLDASLGDMEIVTTGCSLSSVNVSGNEDSGNVILTDGGDSEIENLTLNGSAKVTLDVPTTQVDIDKKALGASLKSKNSIGTLSNSGNTSSIVISGTVDNLDANGENGNINVAANGYIGTANLNGSGSSLTGAGAVAEAYVNADNCSVDTVNTLVTVGDVIGTKVQGNEVKGNSTVATTPPASGGLVGMPPPPEEPVVENEIIIDNDFEDGKHNLKSVRGDVTIRVIDSDDPERGKIAYVGGKSADWQGAGVNLDRYVGKYVTIEISALIKATKAGAVKATIMYNGGVFKQPPGCEVNAPANTWTELNGIYLLDSTINTAILFFEGTGDYYLDDVKIIVKSIGEPIAAETVILNDSELTLNINETSQLTATVSPNNADVRTVTWSSSNPSVAIVDQNGIVKGIKAGEAIITATSNCPYAKTKPVARCEVKVENVETMDLNRNYIFFTYKGETQILSADVDASWTSSNEAVVTVSDEGLVTAVGKGTARITANAPGKVGICTVNVELQPGGAYVFDFDDDGVGAYGKFVGSGKANIAKDPINISSTNKVLKIEPSNYSQFAYVEIDLPAGKKLGDYTSLLAKIHLAQGDVGNKRLVVLAGKNLSDLELSDKTTPSQIGRSDMKSENSKFEPIEAKFDTMSSTIKNLTGKVILGFGVHCSGKGAIGGNDVQTIYYLDELVLVPYTGEQVPITGVSLNKDTLTLAEGRTETLEAIVNPENYTTTGEITWASSDEGVVTVDANGTVTAVSEGDATVTVTVKEIESQLEYTDTCTVTVTEGTTNPSDMIVIDFEDVAEGTAYPVIGYHASDASAKVVKFSDTNNQVLEIKPANYNSAAVLKITIPAGMTLGDYSKITYNAYWKEGDVGWKHVAAVAGKPLGENVFNAENDARRIGSYYRNAGPTSGFQSEEFDIEVSSALGELSGEIEIALGISCKGPKSDPPGDVVVYYLDDITLVPKEGAGASSEVIADSSKPLYGLYITPSAVSGSALTVGGVENVVVVSGGALVAAGQKHQVASIELDDYIGRKVTISAKIMRSTSGNLAWQLSSDYSSIDPKWGAEANQWYSISGSATINSAGKLYLTTGNSDTPEDILLISNTVYYIADVVIKIE